MTIRFSAALPLLTFFVALAAAQPSSAFVPDDRWGLLTASGFTGQDGDPVTLTWSLVPDDTSLVGQGPSNLISFMDTNFGAGPGGSDFTQRPWFHFFEDSFDRWTELGGLTYVYEPNDDAATQGSSTFGSRGLLGVRGDVRIGGAFNDGPGNTLAFNYLPDNGDMVLDTGDGAFFSNSFSDRLQLRNTIMHEAGHGFGLNHVESSTSDFLLEPSISTAYDGPQFDDIRGLQWFYGDALEKGSGNDTAANATSLGSVSMGSTVSIGTDAVDTFVSPTDTDFISIDRNTDIDFFSFSTSGPSLLDVVLSPLGATYNQGVQGAQGGAQTPIDTLSISNLALTVFDTDGLTELGTANNTGAGFAEMLTNISLPAAGDYFVRITGDDEIVQFYQLDVTVADLVVFQTADFNKSGSVDSVDLVSWQAALGISSGGDTDADGDTDGLDFLTWQQQFNPVAPLASSQAIPEPSTTLLALLAGLTALVPRVSK